MRKYHGFTTFTLAFRLLAVNSPYMLRSLMSHLPEVQFNSSRHKLLRSQHAADGVKVLLLSPVISARPHGPIPTCGVPAEPLLPADHRAQQFVGDSYVCLATVASSLVGDLPILPL